MKQIIVTFEKIIYLHNYYEHFFCSCVWFLLVIHDFISFRSLIFSITLPDHSQSPIWCCRNIQRKDESEHVKLKVRMMHHDGYLPEFWKKPARDVILKQHRAVVTDCFRRKNTPNSFLLIPVTIFNKLSLYYYELFIIFSLKCFSNFNLFRSFCRGLTSNVFKFKVKMQTIVRFFFSELVYFRIIFNNQQSD